MVPYYKYKTSFLQPIIASADIDQEDIKISKKGIKCKVNELDYQGSDVVLSLQFGNQSIFAKIDSKKVEELDNQVYINWDNNNLHLFETISPSSSL